MMGHFLRFNYNVNLLHYLLIPSMLDKGSKLVLTLYCIVFLLAILERILDPKNTGKLIIMLTLDLGGDLTLKLQSVCWG